MNRHTALALIPFVAACAGTPSVEAPRWSDRPVETALIWNGFDHEWGYNHRLNRLGNWVGPLSCDDARCEAEVAHAAASGLGSDTAVWTTSATAVHAPGVGFLAGSTEFRLEDAAAEGRYVERRATVTIDATGLLADREQYAVLLQGYDLFALGDADMFRALRVEVGEVTDHGETLSFPVTLGLQVDCDAFECDGTWDVGRKFDESVRYGAIVMWQVIGADGEIAVSSVDVQDGYAWQDETSDEIEREDYAIAGTIEPGHDGAFDAAVLGVQALRIRLDHPSHLVEFATGVSDLRYDAGTGRADYQADLFFKQWNAGTADRSTSYTTYGEVETAATLALVRFRDARTERVHAAGSVDWEADGTPATDDSAVDRRAVAIFPTPTK